MKTNSTHEFPRILPGLETIPVNRGAPRGCSEAALTGAARERRPA